MACVTVGISGAVLTLHVSPKLTVLALAELGVALAGAVLVAFCGRSRARGPAREKEPVERGS